MKENGHFPTLLIRAALLLVFKASLRLDVEGSQAFLPLVPLGDSGLAPTPPLGSPLAWESSAVSSLVPAAQGQSQV